MIASRRDLSNRLARTERDATYNPGEDYRGPVYGESVVRSVTRNVTFVLPLADNAERTGEITGEGILWVENFPELFAAVRQAACNPSSRMKLARCRRQARTTAASSARER